MNEFEWLKQTRALRQPHPPSRDLWPDIAARLGTQTATPPQPARRWPWAIAAALGAVSLLAGLLAWQQTPAPATRLAQRATPTTSTPWKPRDPHFVGAAIELNLARQQLARAIRRAPRDRYLRELLEHTNQQLLRLHQLEQRAG